MVAGCLVLVWMAAVTMLFPGTYVRRSQSCLHHLYTARLEEPVGFLRLLPDKPHKRKEA